MTDPASDPASGPKQDPKQDPKQALRDGGGPARSRAGRPAGHGFFDFTHPFYRPLWRRLLIVAAALGWAVVEALGGSPGWALVFAALGAAALWGLFIARTRATGEGAGEREDQK